MKKATSIIILIIFISFSSLAQTDDKRLAGGVPEQAEKAFKMEEAFNKLGLTDDQRATIRLLNEILSKNMRKLNRDTLLTVEEKRAKRQAILQEHEENMEAVLAPEQRQQLATLKQQFEEAGKSKRKEKFKGFMDTVALTPEQSKKVAELNAKLKSKIRSIRINKTITVVQKNEQIKSLMKKHRQQLESLLTDEQKKQLKNSRRNWIHGEAV